MSLEFKASQPSKYAVGNLILASGEKKALTDATFENAAGAMTSAPTGLRGWLLRVKSGDVGFAPADTSTLTFTPPSGALSDDSASDLTGLFAHELGGGNAEIELLAIVGGIS